jgi:hypothetical protein
MQGGVLLGDYPTATAITTLVAANGEIEIPNTYTSVGYISEDGATFSKARETSDIRAWGVASFVRRDIVSEDNTVQFTALETNLKTLELKHNRSLGSLEVTTEGELAIPILSRPDQKYWRVVTLGKDGSGTNLIYFAKVYHKATVTEMDDEAWTDGDGNLSYNVTMSAEPDATLGTIGMELIFGPGLLAKAVAMGFTIETP